MAAAVYPATLPGPTKAAHTPKGQVSSPNLPGVSSFLLREQDYCETLDVEFFLTSAQASEFYAWWRDTLLQGGNWFNCSWPALRSGTSTVQFLSEPVFTHVYDGAYRTAASLQARGASKVLYVNACALGPPWTAGSVATVGTWARQYNATYGNGVFVTLSGATDNKGFRSTDFGRNWSAISPGVGEWKRTAYGNGLFVGVAGNTSTSQQATYSSNDGATWTSGTFMPAPAYWYSLGYGNGYFISLAYNSTSVARTTNGSTWSSFSSSGGSLWRAVAYDGVGRWVAVSEAVTTCFSTNDGANWTGGVDLPSGSKAVGITYLNGTFFVNLFDAQARIVTSTDGGLTWVNRTMPRTGLWEQVEWSGTTYVSMGAGAALGYVAYSRDGVTWYEAAAPAFSSTYSLGQGAGTFVAINPLNGKAYWSECI